MQKSIVELQNNYKSLMTEPAGQHQIDVEKDYSSLRLKEKSGESLKDPGASGGRGVETPDPPRTRNNGVPELR